MKYAWIAAQHGDYPLPALCTTLAVSGSGYRAWAHGEKLDWWRLTDAQLLARIRVIHAELKGAYGSPRILRDRRSRGFPAGNERVELLMRENEIRARHKRRYKATTDSKHALPVALNVLHRNPAPTVPNQVRTADRAYIWTDYCLLVVPVDRAQPVQSRSRRLVDQFTDDRGHRGRRADDDMVPVHARAGADLSLRPQQPV